MTKFPEDISSGKVDLVAICEADRITMPLPAFAWIVEAFDAMGVNVLKVWAPESETIHLHLG